MLFNVRFDAGGRPRLLLPSRGALKKPPSAIHCCFQDCMKPSAPDVVGEATHFDT